MPTFKLKNFAAIVCVCGVLTLIAACRQAPQNEQEAPAVETTELFRTSQSWDGAELPDYLTGRPELVARKYVFPAGQELAWHHHPEINFGVLVEGELTIIGADGKEKTLHAGEGVVEMVGTVHHGQNRGTRPAVLYMFYLAQKDMPLSIPDEVKE